MPAQSEYDPGAHLSIRDIAAESKSSPTNIQITIKQFKTGPFRQGVQLYLGKTSSDICPMYAILPCLAVQGGRPGPFFMFLQTAYT